MLETLVLRVGVVSLTCSAVLLPPLLLTRQIHNRYAARTCYFLWLLLALRLVLPFQITLPTPAVTVEAPSYAFTIPSAQNTAVNAAPGTPQAQPPAAPETPAAPVRTVPLMEILGAAWLAGAVIYGGFCLLTYTVARRRLLSRARPAEEGESALLQQLAKEISCRHAARLYRSEGVCSPMMLGLARPVILLPARPIAEEELAVILRHELTHLKRWDIAYKLLLLTANGIHWFNPLVWWMAREAAHNLELCCDDDVVRRRDKEFRRLYGEVLLRTAQAPGPMPALSTRFGSDKVQMKGRLMNMFQNKRNSALLVCLVFFAALLLGSLVSAKAGSPGSRVGEEEAFDRLEESITYEQGTLSFTVPDADIPSGLWHIHVTGRLEYPDGFSSSAHYFNIAEWTRGTTYSEQIGESAPYFTALLLDMELGEYQRSIDLIPYVQLESGLLYTDWERGFTLQFPEEWSGLVEVESDTEDRSLLTLYQSVGRREDGPAAGAGVLANLCVTTEDSFNELYGGKNLDGMYENGGPRIWVLGTVGEDLIYLHVDRLPDGGADQGVEFVRLHQQLEQSPWCMTFIPFSPNEPLTAEQAAEILKEQLILAYENTYGEYIPAAEKPDGAVDDSEYLAWAISHLELSDEDGQYYKFDVIFPFWVDKSTGKVFKHYNGLDPVTWPFDPADINALSFAG